jgi:hypothetical protein
MLAGKASDQRPTFLRRASDVWATVKTITLNANGAAVFLCILVILYNEVAYPAISISSISVPKDLSEKGYTEEAAAFELRDSLTQIIQLARIHNDLASINLGSNEPSIILPETGISLDFISNMIRRIFRIGTKWKTSCVITVVETHYVVYLSMDNGIYFYTKEISIDDIHIKQLFTATAQYIFEITDPIVLAASLQDTDRDRAMELANNIIETYPKGSSIVEYAHIVRGNIFLFSKNIDQGILEYQNAIVLDPKNSAAHMDICGALAARLIPLTQVPLYVVCEAGRA